MIRGGSLFDPGALERRGLKFGGVEKIRRAKMLVQGGDTGVQAAERNADLHGRFGWVSWIKLQRAFALGELGGRIREAQVIPAKHSLGIVRFERVWNGVERRRNES